MHKFEELVETLAAEMARGTYKKGERLPTTPELCRIYGVSNTTVKRAMDELELRGMVARRRGSGVFVKETTPGAEMRVHDTATSSQMEGLSAEMGPGEHGVESVIHDYAAVQPEADIAEQLAMGPDEFAYRICRTRVVDGVPKVTEYTYMPMRVVPGLRRETLEGSIYGFIEGELGLKIGSAHRTIRAVMPTADERAWLEVGEGEPLLEVRQVAYLDDGTPFEHSVSRHTSDYEFYTISTR